MLFSSLSTGKHTCKTKSLSLPVFISLNLEEHLDLLRKVNRKLILINNATRVLPKKFVDSNEK